MREIGSELEASRPHSLCLKPLSESSSVDAILMKRFKGSMPGETRQYSDVEEAKTLAAGLAAHIYSTGPFGRTERK